MAGRSLRTLTIGSLLGLAIGVALGVLSPSLGDPGRELLVPLAGGLIRAWTNALRILVVPLVVSQLYLALASGFGQQTRAGRLGALTPVVFAGSFIVIVLLTVGVMLGAASFGLFDAIAVPPATAETAITGAAAPGGSVSWVDTLVPPNLVAAATTDNLLPLMVFAVAFGLAARRLGPELQGTLQSLFRAVSGATFVLVEWTLLVTPLVVLALGYRTALDSGARVGGILVGFTAVEITCLLLALAALYPLASLLGGISPGRFARAMVPSQIAAATSRSSLATIPALLRAAEGDLRLSPAVSASVIPLAGATLKLSRAVSNPCKLIFLAAVLGVTLDVRQVVIFLATILLLSPTTPGVPRVTSGLRSLPAYVAAGIPPEYVVLLGATTVVTDVFMTVLNATGYMTVNVILSRWTGPAPATAPSVLANDPAAVPEGAARAAP